MHRNLVSINILLYSAPGSFQDAKSLQAKDFWIPIIWRCKDISSWISYKETNKKEEFQKLLNELKKLIINITFSPTQTMTTRTTQRASSTYSVWRTPHWLNLLFANTGQNKFSISSLEILMNSSPLPQAMDIFVTGFLQTK